MPSERIQRQIDRLLDEAERALGEGSWILARELAQRVLTLDPENADASVFLAAAERGLGGPLPGGGSPDVGARFIAPTPEPSAFANGRYQVKKFLGEGGKKRVYLAHDSLLDRDIAFALIKTEGLDDAGRLRIQREAQAMGRLGAHPHIVSVFDLGDEAGQPFIVTELMGGGDVEGLIEKAPEQRPPLELTLEIGQQVCRGLEFAHTHGIVHRDLKPGNVWLTADGTAKLGDFGLAVALDKSRLTQGGMMVGTVSYMPPEQAMGGEVTPGSDLYSLGAMLYEMVTGRPPFVGDESVAIITQHLNIPPVSPSWHRPDCPPALEALILRLLEKDPSKRPASAGEVLATLGSIAAAGAGAINLAPTADSAGSVGAPLMAPTGSGPGGDAQAPGNTQAATDNPIYRRTFVGREQELRQLQNAFDGALSGRGALVTVVGEPGIGKTALCEQLATYVAVRGGKALVGHCYEEGSLSLPYLPFVEALRSYVLAREPEQLRSELGSGAADVARIVSEIREKVPVVERPAGDPEDERYRLYQAVTGFLRNAATVQPLVIVLEDLHWADGGTLDFLLHLSRNLAGARLLIAGTYRDVEVDRAHPLSGALAELRRAASFSRVVLRGLTVDEVHRMINALHGQEVRWSLAEAIHRQTEGNPLFIQEVLRFMVEEGLITHEGGRWHRVGETPPELGIPEGLRDVIGKRLSRLSPECNRLLAIASVVGRDFDLAILRRVAESDEEALTQALEEALKVGVLEEQARLARLQYRFTHAFFRQTLYEEMSGPRRLRWHQLVARALEAQYPNRLEEHAAEMAEHFAQSTDPADLSKAIHYGVLAASKAVSVFAYGEAVRLLERAIEVQEVLDPDDAAKRCDLLLALGEALLPAGEPKRAADEVAPQALASAEHLGDGQRASHACQMALEGMDRYGGARVQGSPEFGRWAERADHYARPGSVERVYADICLSMHKSTTGHTAEARALQLQALELARRLSEPEAIFDAAGRILIQQETVQLANETRRVADEVSALPREGVRGRTLGQLLWYGALNFLRWGERSRFESLTRELEELAERTRDPNLLFRTFLRKCILATLDGDLEGALAVAAEAAERSEEMGIALLGRGQAAGWSVEARLCLGKFEEGLTAAPDTYVGGRAVFLAHLARRQEAEAELSEFLKRLDAGKDAAFATRSFVLFLETATLLGNRQAVATLASHLAPVSGLLVSYQGCFTSIGRHLGAAAALLGEREQAMAYYQQALEVCEKVRFRPEIALTHLQMAELLLEGPHLLTSSPSIGGRGTGLNQPISSPPGLGERPGEGASGDRDTRRVEALSHLDFAIAEFRTMKMQPSLERALRHKDVLKA